MNPTLKIAPATAQIAFISLVAAKQHLKVDFDYEDALISAIVLAAIQAAEDYTGLFVNQKDVVLGLGSFPESFELDYFPVIDEAVNIEYSDVNNQAVVLSGEYDFFNGQPKPILTLNDPEFSAPELYDRVDAVRFSFKVGMTENTLPGPMYQAMLLMIGDMYHYREDRPEHISKASMALMRPYKVFA